MQTQGCETAPRNPAALLLLAMPLSAFIMLAAQALSQCVKAAAMAAAMAARGAMTSWPQQDLLQEVAEEQRPYVCD